MGPSNFSLTLRQSRFDEFFFMILEGLCERTRGGQARCVRTGKPGLLDPKGIPGAEDYRSFDDILQLPNIAWPGIGLAQPERIFVDLADLLARFLRVALHEVLDQHRNVFLSVPKRRYVDGEDVQPVKEI